MSELPVEPPRSGNFWSGAAQQHTVIVHPGETVRFQFLADNPGRWFFHCHNLNHREAGMIREWIDQA